MVSVTTKMGKWLKLDVENKLKGNDEALLALTKVLGKKIRIMTLLKRIERKSKSITNIASLEVIKEKLGYNSVYDLIEDGPDE